MNTLSSPLATVCSMLGLALSANTFAFDSGDWLIHLGAASVLPNDSSSALALNGTNLEDLGLGLPVSEASVDTSTQFGLTITYMLNPSWGIELLAASPFKHNIEASGLNVKAGSTKQLPPTVSLQYYPIDNASSFQPYIGLGLNYTVFFDEKVDGELNTALNSLNVGVTGDADLDLKNSWGLAAEAGINYQITDSWLLNASIWYADIDTEATIDVPGLGNITADVEIDPWVFMLAIGYKI